MQHLPTVVDVDVITVGTQVVLDATTVGTQVVNLITRATAVDRTWVTTEVESPNVGTPVVLKRVAVGVRVQAIRDYS